MEYNKYGWVEISGHIPKRTAPPSFPFFLHFSYKNTSMVTSNLGPCKWGLYHGDGRTTKYEGIVWYNEIWHHDVNLVFLDRLLLHYYFWEKSTCFLFEPLLLY